jgi:hypothetical protein
VNYRERLRWGLLLTGLALTGAGAHKTLQDRVFVQQLSGFPGDATVPAAMKMALVMDAAGTMAVFGFTLLGYFGLRKWANVKAN